MITRYVNMVKEFKNFFDKMLNYPIKNELKEKSITVEQNTEKSIVEEIE